MSEEQERLHLLYPGQALRDLCSEVFSMEEVRPVISVLWVTQKGIPCLQANNQQLDLDVRVHSTRSMPSSKALLSGVSLQEICDAAGLATQHTFMRFYSLHLSSTPGSQVLSS